MEELTTVILSGIAWDAIKSGMIISANYLKSKLSNWLLDDSQLEVISNYIQNIPASCNSEGKINKYLKKNQELSDILKEANQKNLKFSQKVKGDQNIIIGYSQGPVTINNGNTDLAEKDLEIQKKKIKNIRNRS